MKRGLVIINKKEPVSITIGMMFFLFFYYPMTFNLMKQSIAMGFMILAFSCYHSSKKKNIEGLDFSYLSDKDVVRHPLVQKIIAAYEKFEKRS